MVLVLVVRRMEDGGVCGDETGVDSANGRARVRQEAKRAGRALRAG